MEIVEANAKVVESNDVGIVVELRWRQKSSDEIHRRYQALRLRDGLVFDMQDYRREREALRALRQP